MAAQIHRGRLKLRKLLLAASILCMATAATPALSWPCPVDFVASIDDDWLGFSTMISKRHYRFVPPDESGFGPDTPNPKNLPVDPRNLFDDAPFYLTLGQRIAICNDRDVTDLDDSKPHRHVLIDHVR
jgi:hypothetical protein